MEQKYLLIGIFSFVFIFGLFMALSVFGTSSAIPNSGVTTSSANDGIAYHSSVCVDVVRIDGTREQLGCSHNNLTNSGKELLETMLASANPSATSGNMTFICLGNSSAVFTVSDANTTLDNMYNITSGAGLNVSAGTYVSQGNGNWSIYKTFTSATNNLKTNVTCLGNSSVGAGTGDTQNFSMFAWNRFSDVTLQSADQLTVNWTVWVA